MLCFPISAQIAERYRAGRVFLVGDAAHAMPPTGGFGANVGIQDAYDLAWKLAFVLQDQASARLLETYQAERLPVAEFTLGQALARTHDRMRSGTAPDGPPLADYAAVVFGYQYRSTAIPGAIDDETTALTSRELRAQPGTRAPHATVTTARGARSILDLFGSDFTLVVGRDGAPWRRAASAVAARLQLPLTLLQLDSELEDASGQLQERYRLGTEAAVLIRPDGFVAWRCEHENADSERAFERVLERVLERILGKESSARTSLAPRGLVH